MPNLIRKACKEGFGIQKTQFRHWLQDLIDDCHQLDHVWSERVEALSRIVLCYNNHDELTCVVWRCHILMEPSAEAVMNISADSSKRTPVEFV